MNVAAYLVKILEEEGLERLKVEGNDAWSVNQEPE